ncbi:BEM2 [Candida margitis]|uniref:BEM2 n=1 Tax=Candida margitis TaxID=1775924 RepID=UPI0022280B47|nr:BEM2 [Candida margitis]KAI5970164.1 BEM2 [Candida margitis]
MRKIWSRKDKEKRRSISTPSTSSTTGNNPSLVQKTSQTDLNGSNTTLSSSEFNPDSSYYYDNDISSIMEESSTNNTTTSDRYSSSGRKSGSAGDGTKGTLQNATNFIGTGAYNKSRGSVAALDNRQPIKFQDLIRQNHDSTMVKHSWVNVIGSNNDVKESNLKLYRAELKGSHLYLYKPQSSLNVKRFKVNEVPVDEVDEEKAKKIESNHLNDAASDVSTLIADAKSVDTGRAGVPSLNHQSTSSTTGSQLRSNSNSEPSQDPKSVDVDTFSNSAIAPISYYKAILPHPELCYDFKLHHFQARLFTEKDNSVESVVHFLCFVSDPRDDSAVNTIIHTLPILPDFGYLLKYISFYLGEIFDDKFDGDIRKDVIIERFLKFLYSIEYHFEGFLLKSDTAPHILKILEILSVQNIHLEKIGKFKSDMLRRQQLLIQLVSNDNLPGNIQPFKDLDSQTFMREIKLTDFAQVISEIDLKYFSNWNSNLDKSLLLYSAINAKDSSKDSFYKKNPLIFNNNYHIHYLSRLLINHIFVENGTGSQSFAVMEAKARILEKWIDLGCLLDKSGNMSSWLGISSVILSQPVLRLTKIWSLVSPDYIKLLKHDWSPVLFELDRRYLVNDSKMTRPHNIDNVKSPNMASNEDRDFNSKNSYHIMAPRGLGKIYPKEKVIPYFGDLVINNNGCCTDVDVYEMESIWKRINYSFDRWNDYLSNLSNFNEIIKYNEDVLRRYDTMGFIFSNESLNQVLYLGANNHNASEGDSSSMSERKLSAAETAKRADLKNKLLRLIELNCDSMNLENIMTLSVQLEPDLPEAYLNAHNSSSVSITSNPHNLSRLQTANMSGLSLNSVDSLSTTTTGETGPDFTPTARIPTFNNQYFRLDLLKYDELASAEDKRQPLDPSVNKHNVVIDDELTFRIDDFVADVADQTSGFNSVVEDYVTGVDDDDDIPGLGIDVDDILNSDKFNNLTMSPKMSSHRHRRSTSGSGLDNRSSMLTEGTNIRKMYKFIPKYATVDKLIDLLLLEGRYFHHDVHLDLTEYRFVFLLNYNSFMTTKELLDKLAHRFVNSGNAVLSVMKKNYLMKKNNDKRTDTDNESNPLHSDLPIDFPNWDLDQEIDLNELGEVDYELLLKIQINILKVLIVLINSFYSNFSLNLANKSILIKLLKLFSNEILQWYNSNKIDASLERSFESLVTYYKKLKKIFVKKTYRPIEITKFNNYLINEFRFNNSLHEVPVNRNLPSHKNIHKIEKFLNKFNKLLTVFYKGIRAEDWIKVFKILENSFELNTLFEFNLQRPNVPEDQMIVSNIFNFFETLVSPTERQLILKKFPLVFRKLFKLYFRFKTYLLVQLIDVNISSEERLDRMKTLLIMAKISKLKMSDNQFVFEGSGNVPSCIETAIVNVIYSPESRAYANLWMRASNILDHKPSEYNTLDELIPSNIDVNDLQSTEPLLPCFGWVIENLISIDKCPSFHKSLINFNKRYLIFKLIKELGVEDIESGGAGGANGGGGGGDVMEFSTNESREFDFLLKLDESLVVKRAHELVHDRDRFPLFRTVLAEQHRILVSDNHKKYQRDAKTNEVNQLNLASNAATSNMHTITRKTSNTSLRRQSLTYKSNPGSRFKLSGIFSKTKSFSLSGGNNSGGNSGTASATSSSLSAEKSVFVNELPSPDTQAEGKQKPSVVIALRNKKIFPVYLLPFGFKIDSDSSDAGGTGGGEYFVQAHCDVDLNDWLIKLNYANRHWFYSRILNFKINNNNNLVFGIPLSFVTQREQSMVPRFLQLIFNEIETFGIKDVGVYRISSSLSDLASLKQNIDRCGSITPGVNDVHVLTGVVKSYLRELPDALLPDEVINQFFQINKEKRSGGRDKQNDRMKTKETNGDKKETLPGGKEDKHDELQNIDDEEVQELIKYKTTLFQLLPPTNLSTLKSLICHLHKINQFAEFNKMTSSNIATVIGPALTEASNLALLINNFGFINLVLEKLVVNYEFIFETRAKRDDVVGEEKESGGSGSEEKGLGKDVEEYGVDKGDKADKVDKIEQVNDEVAPKTDTTAADGAGKDAEKEKEEHEEEEEEEDRIIRVRRSVERKQNENMNEGKNEKETAIKNENEMLGANEE